MSGNISSPLPSNLRIPLFYASFNSTQAGVNATSQRALIIGQTITAQQAVPVYIASAAAAAALFGSNSTLALMCATYILNDPLGELWALPLADASGSTAATGSIVVSGPATAAGSLALYIGGVSTPVAVNAGDTATTIAANIATAIAANPSLPLTASAATGTVTLTFASKGTIGNGFPVVLNYLGTLNNEMTPAGVSLAITALSGGATDPVLTSLATQLGTEDFDFIVNPYSGTGSLAGTTALMNDSTGRWSWSEQIFGHVFAACNAASVGALLTLGAALNDQHLTLMGVVGSPSPGYLWAAAYAGAAAPAIRADPARPLQTLVMQGVLAPQVGSRFTKSQQQSLLTTGIAVPGVARDGTVSILREVTTYQTNQFGQSDTSYLDSTTPFTLMAITRQMASAFTTKYPRAKLVVDGTPVGAGQAVISPKIAKAEIGSQYQIMETNGLVEDADAMLAATVVQISNTDPTRLEVLWAPYLVSGLRILDMVVQFRLLAPAA